MKLRNDNMICNLPLLQATDINN
jgi:hypothetical protein